jgi:kynurenine formamidase
LIHTGAAKYFNQPKYDLKHAGLVRSATEYLVDQGVQLIGIDAWGLDRPFCHGQRSKRRKNTILGIPSTRQG